MKITKYICRLAALAALTLGFSSCQDDIDAPKINVPEASVTPNTTLLELKTEFWSDDTNYAKTIQDENDPDRRYIIHGRVISSDEEGNVFKSLVIQDETAALAFSIDSYNLYLNYRVGQEIVMDVTGMTIGKYAGLQQMGRQSWYSNGSTWQVSFMSLRDFEEKAELNGLPEVADIDTLAVSSFSELATTPEGLRKWQSQLVRFRNVYFEEGGKRAFCTEYHTSDNAAQNTNLVDRSGNTIIVRTSGYCTFFNETLPVGDIDLVGILGYYNGSWQVLMLDGEGVLPAGEIKGEKDNPYTVPDAITDAKAGITSKAWVKGYIVGTTQPEVNTVSSDADIQYTAPFYLKNNLIIAPTATTTDYTQCMVVAIPSGSKFQALGNLADNPANLGKEILVEGELGTAYGMPAVTNNAGSTSSFEIEGVEFEAEGLTILASQLTVPGATTIDGYTVTIDKATGYTTPAYHAATQAARTYAGNTISIKGDGLKTIKFTLASDAGYRYTTVSCSTGAITPAQASGDTEFTWVGSASEVTFTVGDVATLGSESDQKGQIRFTQIDINGGGQGGGETPGETPSEPVTPPTGDPSAAATIAASALTVPGTSTVSGYTIVIDKASGATAPVYHANTTAVRLYANNTIAISGGTMTSIKFTLASDAGYRYTTVTPSTGSISPAQAVGDTEFTWVGNATAVTFTVGETATLGSESTQKGQVRFTAIDINGGGNGGSTGGNTGGDNPSGSTTFSAASSVTSGNAYLLVAGGKYSALFNKNYGYMSTTAISGSTSSFTADLSAALTITATTGGYTIATSEGKFLGAKDGYKTFDTTDDSAGARVWTIAIAADGTATITNVATGKTIYQDPTYGSFGVYSASEKESTYLLPTLYTNGQSGSTGGSTGGTTGGDNPGGTTGGNTSTDGTVSILATALNVAGAATQDGITVTIDKASGKTAPAAHAATSAVRLYAGNTIALSGAKMTKITFTLASDAGYRYTTVEPSTGKISPAQAVGDTSFTWVGDASAVTFTVGETATLGSENTQKGQIRFTKIEVTK